MRYAVISLHRSEFEVSLMCRVLEVSRSGHYAWLRRELSERAREDKRLLVHICSIHNGSNKTYGSPRVHEELRAQEISCCKSRVERLMREDGLVAKPKRRCAGHHRLEAQLSGRSKPPGAALWGG